jgi:hypothetical protein
MLGATSLHNPPIFDRRFSLQKSDEKRNICE